MVSSPEGLSELLEEMNTESDRGLALVALSTIDSQLRDTLGAFIVESRRTRDLVDGRNAALGTLSARSTACLALGLIEKIEFDEIDLLRKIRNKFAHDLAGARFASPEIRPLCFTLKTPLPDFAPDLHSSARFRFSNAAHNTILRLYSRPAWVSKERRRERVWVDAEFVRWRNTASEPPPPGQLGTGLFGDKFKLIG